jgi:hypothetical protein
MRSPVTLVSAFLFLAACGGSPAAPAAGTPVVPSPVAAATAPAVTMPAQETPAGPIDGTPAAGPEGTLCHLVTLEEIEAATGLSPTLAQEVPGQCTWLLRRAGDDTNAGVINLIRDPGESSVDTYRLIFDGEDIAGIGDDAMFVEGTNTLFFAHRGTLYFVASGIFGEDINALAINRAVALAALSRL